MTGGRAGVKLETGGHMGSSRGIPFCGLFPLNVFCDLLWLWTVIGIGIGSAVWVDASQSSARSTARCNMLSSTGAKLTRNQSP